MPAHILHCGCACTCTCVLHTILLMVCFNLACTHVLIPRGVDVFLSCVAKWIEIWISKSSYDASFVGRRENGGREKADREGKEGNRCTQTDWWSQACFQRSWLHTLSAWLPCQAQRIHDNNPTHGNSHSAASHGSEGNFPHMGVFPIVGLWDTFLNLRFL